MANKKMADMKADKAKGIKEGSAKDKKMDKSLGIKDGKKKARKRKKK